MTTTSIFLAVVAATLTLTFSNISFVNAGGPRLDWPEDSSDEGKDCWVEGYDDGFAGRYDKERADRCALEADEYNRSWKYACQDGGYTPTECDVIRNNANG
jgi:hypothetical protein